MVAMLAASALPALAQIGQENPEEQVPAEDPVDPVFTIPTKLDDCSGNKNDPYYDPHCVPEPAPQPPAEAA